MCNLCLMLALKFDYVIDDFGDVVHPNEETEENGSFFPLRRMASMSAYGFEVEWALFWWRKEHWPG